MSGALFFTTWPLSFGQGSGTALFVRSLQRAVEAVGTPVELVNPDLDTRDYIDFTLNRLWFNVLFARDLRTTQADWILGLDYDGFALPRRVSQRFIGTARAVFADLVNTEPEPFRTMLQTQAFFEGQNLRQSDLVVTPSQYARQKVAEYYQVPEERIHAIPNGIHLAEWDSLLAGLPQPDPTRRPTVLAVSKLYPRKKIGVLVQAVPFIRQQFPDVDVRIVGGGFEWDALQRLSVESGAEPNLTWLGDINDRRLVAAEFQRCHIFVHPSIQDAFANVCLESMASARPLVVSQAASMPELVVPAGSGLLVPPEDPELLAAAICRLLSDEEQRTSLGQAGRLFAEKMSWENTARRFLALIG